MEVIIKTYPISFFYYNYNNNIKTVKLLKDTSCTRILIQNEWEENDNGD